MKYLIIILLPALIYSYDVRSFYDFPIGSKWVYNKFMRWYGAGLDVDYTTKRTRVLVSLEQKKDCTEFRFAQVDSIHKHDRITYHSPADTDYVTTAIDTVRITITDTASYFFNQGKILRPYIYNPSVPLCSFISNSVGTFSQHLDTVLYSTINIDADASSFTNSGLWSDKVGCLYLTSWRNLMDGYDSTSYTLISFTPGVTQTTPQSKQIIHQPTNPIKKELLFSRSISRGLYIVKNGERYTFSGRRVPDRFLKNTQGTRGH